MNTDKNLPVDMIIVEPTVVEGKHLPTGHVIKKCDTELAMDLAGSGKARPATPELIEQYNPKPKKGKGVAGAGDGGDTTGTGDGGDTTGAGE